jgi:maltooligosyltrehalose synthase
VSPEQLHAYFAERAAKWPYAMSALSTHDTKRSEDVRARINVLSEIPDEWRAAVTRWMRQSDIPGDEAYLLFQTLVGAWLGGPDEDFVERIQAYMLKAMREAKLRTSWTDPNAEHEAKVQSFIARLLTDESFIADFAAFHQRIAEVGAINSLAQTVLKLTAPGVPDTYQGTELPDFSLVDPDNRRPVDYALRRQTLSGRSEPKQRLHAEILRLRRRRPSLFTTAEYIPFHASGEHADHFFAYLRRDGDHQALIVVPRLSATISDSGRTTVRIPAGMQSLLTMTAYPPGETSVGQLFQQSPVAVLVSRISM